MAKRTPAAKTAPKTPRKPRAKKLSPSRAKRKGETTPAEDAHEVVKEMLAAAESRESADWIKAAASKIPDVIEEPKYGAKRSAEYEFHRPPETAPVGRPTPYKPEFVKQAEKLCRLGATDPEIADFFGVDRITIWRWAHAHEEFCNALKSGKEYADERVERSLFNRAVGYSHEAVKIFMPAGAAAPVYAPYTEHIAPDIGAATLWLKNRKPDVWRDKREVDLTVTNELASQLEHARRRSATIEGPRVN